MNDTVKLIIEISKEHYEATKKLDKKCPYMLAGGETAIAHGIPLDDVKAEIEEMPTDYCGGYIGLDKKEVLQILDNIGKADMRGKAE